MYRWTLGLLLILTLSAGACTRVEYVYLEPEIPEQTLTKCAISDRRVKTVKELAALTTEHLRSAECANGKIETIASILDRTPS